MTPEDYVDLIAGVATSHEESYPDASQRAPGVLDWAIHHARAIQTSPPDRQKELHRRQAAAALFSTIRGRVANAVRIRELNRILRRDGDPYCVYCGDRKSAHGDGIVAHLFIEPAGGEHLLSVT